MHLRIDARLRNDSASIGVSHKNNRTYGIGNRTIGESNVIFQSVEGVLNGHDLQASLLEKRNDLVPRSPVGEGAVDEYHGFGGEVRGLGRQGN